MHNKAFYLLVGCLFVSGCGGGAKAKPVEAPPTETAGTDKPPAAEADKSAPGSDTSEPPKETPKESVEKPSRPPGETISAPKVAFVIDYNSSAPNERAEKKCASAKEGAAKAACMAKERKDFPADVLHFKQDKGKLWWISYHRNGSHLVVINTVEVELTDETENTVTVKIIGKDKGSRPIFAGKSKFVVKVPNDYSMEVEDPRLGALKYDAKIDVLSE